METIDDADLATADVELITTAMAEIITVGAVARQALYALPFTRRDAIEATSDNIEGEIRDIIRHVQMVNSSRPEIADALNDLDINGFYDSDDDDEDIDGDDEEESEEEDEEEAPAPAPARTSARGSKNRTKEVAKAVPKASPKAAPKKNNSSSSNKRKAEEEPVAAGARRSSRRKN
jgi:hypothetical protein